MFTVTVEPVATTDMESMKLTPDLASSDTADEGRIRPERVRVRVRARVKVRVRKLLKGYITALGSGWTSGPRLGQIVQSRMIQARASVRYENST